MISFAQNREDVLLARALSDTDCGFYIDVGAWDPTEDSVTRHFYDMGWHGINVEPQPTYAARLRQARPRDITLEIALSDHSGAASLYDVSLGDGLATVDAAHARRLRTEGKICGEFTVQLSTLADVCAEYCAVGDDISFLKIDVEGHEAAVVAGADWSRWMPRIVVVEATEPLSGAPTHEPWESTLVDAGYVFVQFDGLNRWFARGNDNELISRLRAPVSALDAFEPYRWVARVAALEAEVASLSDVVAAASALMTREEVIGALESLQKGYERLGRALDTELAQRAIESEHVLELAAKVRALEDQQTF